MSCLICGSNKINIQNSFCNKHDSEELISVPYVVGENVKVIDGPFNGFSGLIEEINEEKRKLLVMVKIFGRKTPLELNFMQVEKES